MSRFAEVTAVRRRSDSLVYDAELDPGWSIGGKPNGGYLLAVLARAGCDAAEAPHPLAVSGHFLRAPTVGPAEVRVEIVRKGRRVSTTRVTLWQGDRPCLDTLISCGEVPAGEPTGEGEWSGPPPPDLPPPEECIDSAPPNFRVELLDHVELRLDPSTAAFPTPTGEPLFRGWCRLRDGADPDVLSLLVAVDAFPPAVFNLGRFGWAPTVELTVLPRAVPRPGWLRCEARTQAIEGAWFDEEATVWDSTGRVVAQSRQLALAGS